jgi:hypothetical protein
MHLACGLWDMFYTISTIDECPAMHQKRIRSGTMLERKHAKMSLQKNKIVANDSAARIELNPIDQFARTTN